MEKTGNVATEALRQGFHMDLPELLGTLYGDADVHHVLYMTVRHKYYEEYLGSLKRNDVLKSLAENAATDIFFELPKSRKNLVDSFQNAAKDGVSDSDYEKFARDFQEGSNPTSKDDDVALASAYREVIEDGKIKYVLTDETQSFLEDYLAPLLNRATRYGISAHLTDDGADSALYWAQKEACEEENGGKDEPACVKALREFFLSRLPDEPEAVFIERTAGDGKTLISGGATHGSQKDDFEEHLEEYFGEKRRVIKIDVAPNYMIYDKIHGEIVKSARRAVPEIGEDPPDLVYLTEEKMCLTTKNTPDYVLDALKQKGIEFTSLEKLYGQKDTDEQSFMAQNVEKKEEHIMLAEGVASFVST